MTGQIINGHGGQKNGPQRHSRPGPWNLWICSVTWQKGKGAHRTKIADQEIIVGYVGRPRIITSGKADRSGFRIRVIQPEKDLTFC